jgi:hypothetical protein
MGKPWCAASWLAAVAAVTALVIATAGCGNRASTPSASTSTASPASESPAPSPPQAGPTMTITDPYAPSIDPATFSTTVDNPYLPLAPGTRIIYEAAAEDGLERTTVEVTRDTKNVMGVDTVVVHDSVTLDGKPSEDTFDWYAQDRDGNVWYFGEATKKFEDNSVETAGSFEADVNGALPGIIMPGHPRIGDQYRQEYAKGVAEDTGQVLSLTGSETSPLTGAVTELLVTTDADLLDPGGSAETKYYARGVGLILTVHTGGTGSREHAVAVEKF